MFTHFMFLWYDISYKLFESIYREPRGFGFVKYRYADDASEAKQQLNHTIIGGREIRIVFAEENRKTPQEMRTSSHTRCGSSWPVFNDSFLWYCL